MLPTSRTPASAARVRSKFHEDGTRPGPTTYRSDEGSSSLKRTTTNGAFFLALGFNGVGRASWNATAPWYCAFAFGSADCTITEKPWIEPSDCPSCATCGTPTGPRLTNRLYFAVAVRESVAAAAALVCSKSSLTSHWMPAMPLTDGFFGSCHAGPDHCR